MYTKNKNPAYSSGSCVLGKTLNFKQPVAKSNTYEKLFSSLCLFTTECGFCSIHIFPESCFEPLLKLSVIVKGLFNGMWHHQNQKGMMIWKNANVNRNYEYENRTLRKA